MAVDDRQVWIGQVDVRPRPGCDIFDGAHGAYSNALALARDDGDYRRLVEEFFGRLGLDVDEYLDVEPFDQRRSGAGPGHDVSPALVALPGQVSEAARVVYDTFYVYETEEE